MLDKLKEYKEFLVILVFFAGGASWIYGYFATKAQLNEARCLLDANIEAVTHQLKKKLLYDDILLLERDLRILSDKLALGPLSNDEKTRLDNLTLDRGLKRAQLEKSIQVEQQMLNRLRRGECLRE